MKIYKLFWLCLFLTALWNIGCAGPKTITVTRIERIHPPVELVQPIVEPGKPPVPDKELVLSDVIEWYEQWMSSFKSAFRQSEADKAAVRNWIGQAVTEQVKP